MKRIQIYQGLFVPTQQYTTVTILFLHRPGLHPASLGVSAATHGDTQFTTQYLKVTFRTAITAPRMDAGSYYSMHIENRG